jgi:hypothetical protein
MWQELPYPHSKCDMSCSICIQNVTEIALSICIQNVAGTALSALNMWQEQPIRIQNVAGTALSAFKMLQELLYPHSK